MGAVEGDAFVGADLVVEGAVRVDAFGQRDAVCRQVAVEVFVLERLVEALDDAVGLRTLLSRADVAQLGAREDVALGSGCS